MFPHVPAVATAGMMTANADMVVAIVIATATATAAAAASMAIGATRVTVITNIVEAVLTAVAIVLLRSSQWYIPKEYPQHNPYVHLYLGALYNLNFSEQNPYYPVCHLILCFSVFLKKN